MNRKQGNPKDSGSPNRSGKSSKKRRNRVSPKTSPSVAPISTSRVEKPSDVTPKKQSSSENLNPGLPKSSGSAKQANLSDKQVKSGVGSKVLSPVNKPSKLPTPSPKQLGYSQNQSTNLKSPRTPSGVSQVSLTPRRPSGIPSLRRDPKSSEKSETPKAAPVNKTYAVEESNLKDQKKPLTYNSAGGAKSLKSPEPPANSKAPSAAKATIPSKDSKPVESSTTRRQSLGTWGRSLPDQLKKTFGQSKSPKGKFSTVSNPKSFNATCKDSKPSQTFVPSKPVGSQKDAKPTPVSKSNKKPEEQPKAKPVVGNQTYVKPTPVSKTNKKPEEQLSKTKSLIGSQKDVKPTSISKPIQKPLQKEQHSNKESKNLKPKGPGSMEDSNKSEPSVKLEATVKESKTSEKPSTMVSSDDSIFKASEGSTKASNAPKSSDDIKDSYASELPTTSEESATIRATIASLENEKEPKDSAAAADLKAPEEPTENNAVALEGPSAPKSSEDSDASEISATPTIKISVANLENERATKDSGLPTGSKVTEEASKGEALVTISEDSNTPNIDDEETTTQMHGGLEEFDFSLASMVAFFNRCGISDATESDQSLEEQWGNGTAEKDSGPATGPKAPEEASMGEALLVTTSENSDPPIDDEETTQKLEGLEEFDMSQPSMVAFLDRYGGLDVPETDQYLGEQLGLEAESQLVANQPEQGREQEIAEGVAAFFRNFNPPLPRADRIASRVFPNDDEEERRETRYRGEISQWIQYFERQLAEELWDEQGGDVQEKDQNSTKNAKGEKPRPKQQKKVHEGKGEEPMEEDIPPPEIGLNEQPREEVERVEVNASENIEGAPEREPGEEVEDDVLETPPEQDEEIGEEPTEEDIPEPEIELNEQPRGEVENIEEAPETELAEELGEEVEDDVFELDPELYAFMGIEDEPEREQSEEPGAELENASVPRTPEEAKARLQRRPRQRTETIQPGMVPDAPEKREPPVRPKFYRYNGNDSEESFPKRLSEIYSYAENTYFDEYLDVFQVKLSEFGLPMRWDKLSAAQKYFALVLLRRELLFDRKLDSAAKSILHFVQGTWANVTSEVEIEANIKLNAFKLYEMGIFERLAGLLRDNFDNSNASPDKVTWTDNRLTAIILNILCTIAEAVRDEKYYTKSDVYEKYVMDFCDDLLLRPQQSECLIITLFKLVQDFGVCGDTSIKFPKKNTSAQFPIKKALLLLHKLLVLALGDLNELEKMKRQKRQEHYLLAEHQPMNTRVKKPKVYQTELVAYLRAVGEKYQNPCVKKFPFPNRPGYINEGIPTAENHLHIPLGVKQMIREKIMQHQNWAYPEVLERTPTEVLFQAMYPVLKEYFAALTKVIIMIAYKGPQEVYKNVKESIPGVFPEMFEAVKSVDVLRHEEIIMKTLSTILLLLLKHFKLNHVYQYENIIQILKTIKLPAHVIWYLNANLPRILRTDNQIWPLEFPTCVLGHHDIAQCHLPVSNEETYSPRNLFSSINLIRILVKLIKFRQAGMRDACRRGASVFADADVDNEHFCAYASKVLKMIMKFTGAARDGNAITKVYLHARSRLINDNYPSPSYKSFCLNEEIMEVNMDSFLARRYRTILEAVDALPYTRLHDHACLAEFVHNGITWVIPPCFMPIMQGWFRENKLT